MISIFWASASAERSFTYPSARPVAILCLDKARLESLAALTANSSSAGAQLVAQRPNLDLELLLSASPFRQLRKLDGTFGSELLHVHLQTSRRHVRQPEVFLFDEPLSNLDAKLRVNMRAELIKLHERLDATMIYVTHDQVEAMTMGDRIVVMRNGFIQQVGPPMEVYNQPQNQFVAGFIGSPPMNFLDARLVEITVG